MTGQQREGASARGAKAIAAELEPVVASAVRGAGYELEELDVQQAGRRRLVKVIIDVTDDRAAAGAEGVGLDEIAEVSRAVSTALDADDGLFAGAYTLEVTSPGVDRPLTKPKHWRRARLRLVKVKLADGNAFTARVGNAELDPAGGVELLRDGKLGRLGYAEIERAVVEVEFREPPAAEIARITDSGGTGQGAGEGSGVEKEES
ncbi:ribosome maturation factor RimP [Tamaricihabitans halophyticus]|uniref:Ribosome maturation factor RimP n=1 Tax=Tamaricihabitans halophyticus TaxID=1262583 RepID=A0A4R2QCH7_9PSEU|nr:ribosome maturation factor RimP [Tamaricihabitans halophyticus]TCP46742.1 ribosome maturation factor RimP [Tamaricihabitans halophyticus]